MIGDEDRLGGKVQAYVSLGILLDQLLELFLSEFAWPFGLERDHEVRRCEPRAHNHYRCNVTSR